MLVRHFVAEDPKILRASTIMYFLHKALPAWLTESKSSDQKAESAIAESVGNKSGNSGNGGHGAEGHTEVYKALLKTISEDIQHMEGGGKDPW
jgi:hypothetical protein